MALDERKKLTPGYNTEYNDNYKWGEGNTNASSWNKASSGLFDGTAADMTAQMASEMMQASTTGATGVQTGTVGGIEPDTEFHSTQYPSVYRETVLHKDDRGSYINPYVGLASKPYGRRLMYDKTHPMKMYASQYSSELADAPGCYSFPTTTGLAPQQPWQKDMSWRTEGEDGHCLPYDGHSDQPQYSQYKVQVP